MKNKIIYISVFLAAFILTSGAIIYLNSRYSNIFKFDFRPAETLSSITDTLNSPQKFPNDSLLSSKPDNIDTKKTLAEDSLRRSALEKRAATDRRTADSLYTAALNKFTDSSKTEAIPEKINQTDKTLPTQQKTELNLNKEITPPEISKSDIPITKTKGTNEPVTGNSEIISNNNAKEDTLYTKWMKSTAKLYENMEPKKAAKIIASYSDNMARDIIYTMKKKKAAEILAELNPEFASRITRMK
ncbi:MAG: MotE family protein [Ignavibacteria bacterium]